MNRSIIISFSSIFLIIIVIYVVVYNYSFNLVDIIAGCAILFMNGLFINYLSRKQNKTKCNNCGHYNLSKNSNCVKCGSDIEDIVCSICKSVNKYDAKYCAECQTILVGRCEII